MIDPKRLELGMYEEIPHLLTPVVVDPKKAANALRWAVREMEERYKTLAAEGVRNIDQYNRNIRTAIAEGAAAPRIRRRPKPLPFIVVVIDELADLMMVASNEVEESICAAGADGPRRRHPPDPGDAAAVGGRHHRPHQGQPALAHLVPRVVEDRLAHDSRRQRRRAAAGQGRHAVPAAGVVAAASGCTAPTSPSRRARGWPASCASRASRSSTTASRRRTSPRRVGGVEMEQGRPVRPGGAHRGRNATGVDFVPAAQDARSASAARRGWWT